MYRKVYLTNKIFIYRQVFYNWLTLYTCMPYYLIEWMPALRFAIPVVKYVFKVHADIGRRSPFAEPFVATEWAHLNSRPLRIYRLRARPARVMIMNATEWSRTMRARSAHTVPVCPPKMWTISWEEECGALIKRAARHLQQIEISLRVFDECFAVAFWCLLWTRESGALGRTFNACFVRRMLAVNWSPHTTPYKRYCPCSISIHFRAHIYPHTTLAECLSHNRTSISPPTARLHPIQCVYLR